MQVIDVGSFGMDLHEEYTMLRSIPITNKPEQHWIGRGVKQLVM